MTYSKPQVVDTVYNHLENNREDQVRSAIAEMENQVTEDLLDVVDAHLQSNNQASTASVCKEKRIIRRRTHWKHQSHSGPDKKTEGAGAKQPAESYFAWGCRMFKEILENVNKVLKDCTQLVEAMTDLLSQ